jgi:hypothetical protein
MKVIRFKCKRGRVLLISTDYFMERVDRDVWDSTDEPCVVIRNTYSDKVKIAYEDFANFVGILMDILNNEVAETLADRRDDYEVKRLREVKNNEFERA